MGNTKIEWADRVFNPVTGCTRISPGCANCYAERMAKRLAGRYGYPADEPFKVTKHEDKDFLQPIKWRKPSRIFVCSMGDLFHDDVPDAWIAMVIAVMSLTYDHTGEMRDCGNGLHVGIHRQRHTYLILTKRPDRMKTFISDLMEKESKIQKMTACFTQRVAQKLGYPFWMNAHFTFYEWISNGMPGLWLGVTAENQEQADKRIPVLLQTPAEKRFVSVEPMLELVDLSFIRDGSWYDSEGADYYNALSGSSYWASGDHGLSGGPRIDWLICGGESGPGARPMHPDWVRSLRDQCQDAGVPFMFKQWGEWLAQSQSPDWIQHGPCMEDSNMFRVGKKKSGRLLDGQEWNEYPEVTQ